MFNIIDNYGKIITEITSEKQRDPFKLSVLFYRYRSRILRRMGLNRFFMEESLFHRIYAEKKDGFDVESAKVTAEIKEQLQLAGLQSIRILNRYDVDLESKRPFDDFIYGIFAEINQDDVMTQPPILDSDESVFGIEYQPGQYDIRCDSAEQCVRLIDPEAVVKVKHAKLYLIKGDVSETDIEKIKSYMINPVDSTEAILTQTEQSEKTLNIPTVRVVLEGFTDLSDDGLKQMITDQSLAMDLEDIKCIRDYFKLEEKRNPTQTELRVLDTYWSDHCRHTTFSTVLTNITFAEGMLNQSVKDDYESYLRMKKEIGREHKPVTLMEIATMGARYNSYRGLDTDVEVSDEINACSYHIKADIDGENCDYLLMFKNETHNHPTEIEPFGGAATCLGGAIRDPLSGRAYVYQSMRVTGAADPTVPINQTMKGKLPQRKISTQAAAGFSSYGNQIGLCTGQVREYYHPNFAAKRMEVGAVIAAAPKENVVRLQPNAGDLIYVIGGRTGRDGIGGASGSSKEHNVKSVETAGSEVQKGNAPEERKLQRLFRNPDCAKLIKKCNDFGAGGISVAIGELADSLDIDLDTVLLKYEGLNATELAISESQERMAVVIDPKDEAEFLSYVKSENIEYSKTAQVCESGRLIMTFKGQEVLNIKRSFIDTNGADKYAVVNVDCNRVPQLGEAASSLSEYLRTEAKQLNICSQKGLTEIFDNTIGASTVLMPYGGKHMLTPSDVMASKIPTFGKDTKTVSLMSHGFDPELCMKSPYLGASDAVLSSVTKLVCAGADYQTIKLSFQEYFEKLKTDPVKWGKPFSALLGALRIQTTLGISAIGGKDSMSGTYESLDVPPSLISFGVAVTDIDHIVSNELKKSGSSLLLLRPKRTESGLVDLESAKKMFESIHRAIQNKQILTAKACGIGGPAISLMLSAFGNQIGAVINDEISLALLTATDHTELLIETDNPNRLKSTDFDVIPFGKTVDQPSITYLEETIALDELIRNWKHPLENVFPSAAKSAVETQTIVYRGASKKTATVKYAKPRVVIPVFPGTNCEYDTARAFEKSGAVCETLVFRNKTRSDISESVQQMAQMIRSAQIIAFPGGFSAGDEPDGSGKFIVSVLRNPIITEAVTDLLENRDGLILGICNGFQALIKTGLVPYGKISALSETAPTLTFNAIGRHVAKVAYTKLVSDKSVWFSECELGEVHAVALSHGEGRFVAEKTELDQLIRNGQMIAQYCDIDGNISGDPEVNPNGSMQNIEAITSPDGRILGKMGHNERAGSGLYQNLVGNFDQKIFRSGVKYYS